MMGLAAAAENAEAVTCEGSLDVTRYGGVLKARAARGRARSRAGLRRPVLRQERHAQDQARRVQAELHADPQRTGLHSPNGEHMSPAGTHAGGRREALLRQVSRHWSSTISTRCRSAASLRRCRTCWARRHRAGRCRACRRRAFRRAASSCRRSARRCGSSSSRAIRIIRSGPGGFWGTGGRCSGLRDRAAGDPAGTEHCAADDGREHDAVSDAPPTPATGGIVLKSASGAMIVVNETGIYISNGQGATITLIGPAVAINDNRADGGWSVMRTITDVMHERGDARCQDRFCTWALSCICSHGGQAMPTVPSPVVFVSGMPVATIAAPYAIAGCAFVPPAGNGPCVTGQWVVGRDAGVVARPAGRHHDRRRPSACPRARRCCRYRRRHSCLRREGRLLST